MLTVRGTALTSTRFGPLAAVALLLLLTLSIATAPPARAATTIEVTTTTDELNDDGDCSLREAIVAANTDMARDACPAGAGADTILIPAGTYTFAISGIDEDQAATGDLDILDSVTLVGDRPATTIIHANRRDRVFDILAPSIVTLQGLTISGGNTQSDFVERDRGGGIQSAGDLTVRRCVIKDNLADTGGGIAAVGGQLWLYGSTVARNSAGASGGGVFVAGELSVYRSSIMHNVALRESGGGIATAGGTFRIQNSTIAYNTAALSGGGVAAGSDGTFLNATIAGNVAGKVSVPGIGGGIYARKLAGHDVSIRNTIVAANKTSTSRRDDCSGSVLRSLGHNLIGATAGCDLAGTTASDLTNVASGLQFAQSNGGPTRTLALLAGSLAIDAASRCPTHDQRGITRPQDGDGDGTAHCDIGAYEK